MPAKIPFGGIYRGRDGVKTYLRELHTAIEMSPLHIETFVAECDHVAAIGLEKDTLVKSTGRQYSMPFVHMLTFDERGAILKIREYNDISDMLVAFQLTEPSL